MQLVLATIGCIGISVLAIWRPTIVNLAVAGTLNALTVSLYWTGM